MSIKTKTRNGSYKGHILCEIVQVDDNNEAIGKPVVSFGVKKAQAILNNIEGIERFVKNNIQPTSADNINLDNMSTDEKNKLLAKLLV